MPQELKSCPFCGDTEPYSLPVYNCWGVTCVNGCCDRTGDFQEDAEAAWNTRAQQPPQPADGDVVNCNWEEALNSLRDSISVGDAGRWEVELVRSRVKAALSATTPGAVQDELAQGALDSIRALLDDGCIPRGTFADDQVRNLVALYNLRGDRIAKLEACVNEALTAYASIKELAEKWGKR